MEVKGAKDNKSNVCLFEAIGTGILMIAMNWGGENPSAMAGTLFGGIMLFDGISGAHFNPAVTLGVLLTGG